MEIRTALVTGGSKGLGRALATVLAKRGVEVVIVARGKAELEATRAAVAAEAGKVHALAYDVGDKTAIHRITGAAAALVGDLDLVVHDASTLGPTPLRPLLDTECEDVERVFAVNFLGPFRLTKAVLGNMVLRGRGTIVSISSDAAVEAYPTWGPYGASKAALDHMTRTWAAEVEGSGVRVLSIDPGEMDTEMHAAALPDADPKSLARPSVVAERIVDALDVGARTRGAPLANGARFVVGAAS